MLKKFLVAISIISIIFSNCFITSAIAKLPSENETIIATPGNNEIVALLSGEIYEFVKDFKKFDSINCNINQDDVFAPNGVKITWTNKKEGATSYLFKLSTTSDFKTYTEYNVTETQVVLEDLYVGQIYYYIIEAKYANETITSSTFSFLTASYPRTITIDGVSNTRDIGGYITEDGKHRIKQGVAYRGAELEKMKDSGLQKALNTYKIKTELDLRGNDDTVSAFGENVKLLNYKFPWYSIGGTGINAVEYKIGLKEGIRAFADKSNFPIFFHCSLGRDRTGTLAFLINALCGVSEKDLYLDYELSALSKSGHYDGTEYKVLTKSYFKPLYDYMSLYEGDTYAKKVENFMLELGITSEEIAAIRENMLDDIVEIPLLALNESSTDNNIKKTAEKSNSNTLIIVIIITVTVLIIAGVVILLIAKKK